MTANANSNLQRTYYSLKTEFRQEPYITQAKHQHVRRTLARFRTGCHWLQVCMGRRHQVEHDERWCPSCTNCVDDEMHAIFYCRSYALQRSLFSDLFETAQTLRAFLASNPPHRVALFLEACASTRLNGLPSADLDSTLSLGQIDDYDSS